MTCRGGDITSTGGVEGFTLVPTVLRCCHDNISTVLRADVYMDYKLYICVFGMNLFVDYVLLMTEYVYHSMNITNQFAV